MKKKLHGNGAKLLCKSSVRGDEVSDIQASFGLFFLDWETENAKTKSEGKSEKDCMNAVKKAAQELNEITAYAISPAAKNLSKQGKQEVDQCLADKFTAFNTAINKVEQINYENKTALKKQLGGFKYFFLEVANLFSKDKKYELLHKFRNVVALARKDLQKSFKFKFIEQKEEAITTKPQVEEQQEKPVFNNMIM
jgi:hypothetical protein